MISDSPEHLSQGPMGLGAPHEGEFVVFFYTQAFRVNNEGCAFVPHWYVV